MRILFIALSILSLTLINTQEVRELKFLQDNYEGCWLSAHGRGIGKPIHTCKSGLEKSGLLCYPNCEQNYTGVGPVCWQNCAMGFHDDGAFCRKPSSYGRGAGYTSKDHCESENLQGCEIWGLIYYPKCMPNFHNVACCVCSPDCQDGMTDIGVSCTKKSYGRGAGYVLTCSEEEDYDAGLCYVPCQQNFKPIGPVCWGQCPAGYSPCGALCLKGETCAGQIKKYLDDVVHIIEDFSSGDNTRGIIDVAKFASDLTFPICS
jgi:hypothetical protein